jgi:DHA2 family multidrug resistance protein
LATTGGYITDHFQWPYIFYINIPLGVIAALLTLQFVKSPKYHEKSAAKDIDWIGIGFLALFVGSLQYVLEKGQEEDWFNSSTITFLAVMSALGCFFFIWRESTFRNPIVNLKVLGNGNLRIGTIMSLFLVLVCTAPHLSFHYTHNQFLDGQLHRQDCFLFPQL